MDQMEYQDAYGMDLCKVCGRRTIDRSTGNPHEFMCRECRQEKTKLRIPKWLIIALSVAGAVTLAMVIYLVSMQGRFMVPDKQKSAGNEVLLKARELIAENKQWQGLGELDNYLKNNSGNVEIAQEALRLSMQYGFYDYAAYFINTYLMDKTFSDDELFEINGYMDELDKYYNTYDAINAVFTEISEASKEDLTEEEANAIRNEMKEKVLAIGQREDCEEKFADFYVAYYLCDSVEECEKYFTSAYGYLPIRAEACGRLAVMERRRGNFEEAERWIRKGKDTNGDSTELQRAELTIFLAKGEYDKTLPAAEELFYSDPQGTYVADTYIVALYANNETDKLNEFLSSCDDAEYGLEEDLYRLLDGEITVREYYVEEEE